MAKVETFEFSRPPFLASEVGLVLKTATVSSASATTENGRAIVKAGTVISGKGILFQDIDVTGVTGGVECPVMIGGWVYPGKITGDITAFKGIYTYTEPAVERPYEDGYKDAE